MSNVDGRLNGRVFAPEIGIGDRTNQTPLLQVARQDGVGQEQSQKISVVLAFARFPWFFLDERGFLDPHRPH